MNTAITQSISKRSFFLLSLDIAAIGIAYGFAFYLRTGQSMLQIDFTSPHLYFSFLVFPFVFYIFDLYYPFKYFIYSQTLVDVLLSTFIGAMILASMAFFDRTLLVQRGIFFYMSVSLVPLVLGIRLIYDFLFRYRFLDHKTLIIGTGSFAREIAELINGTPHSGMELVGLVYEDKKPSRHNINHIPVVGGMENLLSLIDWYGTSLVVLAMDPKEEMSETKVMSELLRRRVMVTSAIHLYERITGEVPYRLLGGHYLLGLMSQIKLRPYLKLKRAIDLFFSVWLLICLSPVLLIAIFFTGLTQSGKVFFKQVRIGKNGRPFRLYKLITMTDGKKGRRKITGLGRWMRRYRIDEIPQLINVFKGDMSLIGPRPEVPYFVNRSRKKIPFYDAVFSVKPGLTGWAQVKFRHATTVKDYNQKFRYNLYYLKNISLALDLVILLRTIRVVLLGKGK